MSDQMSDDDLDAALRTWARETIATTTAHPFTALTKHRPTQRERHRWLVPTLAAAAVLILASASLIIRGAHSGTTSSAGPSQTTRPAVAQQCPVRLPAPGALEPPPGTPDGSLFPRPVARMTACSYSAAPLEPGSKLVSSVPLDANLSAQLAQHLDAVAPLPEDGLQCQGFIDVEVLLASDDQGGAFPPVVLTVGCRQLTATNGVVSRHLDLDDDALQHVLTTIRSAASASPPSTP